MNQDFNELKKSVPSFKERIEIGMRMFVKLLFEEKREHLMLISFTLSEDFKEGQIESVTHTSPGNGEGVLRAALSFYVENNASAYEEDIEDT